MFKFVVVFAGCLAIAVADVVHPVAPVAAVAYANAALYAPDGTQQVDVRHNYDGTLSSYTTTPFGYTSPISSRYVAAPAPVAPVPVAGPVSFAAPTAYAAPAGIFAPFAAPYTAPYSAGFAAPVASPFAAAPAKLLV